MNHHPLSRVALGVAGAALSCVAYGVVIERRWYATRVNQVKALRTHGGHTPDEVHTPGKLTGETTSEQRPLRIALFSDLHYRPGQTHRLNYVMNAVVNAQPDLVVSAGDNLEHADGIDAVIATHAAISAALPQVPAIAALGAHDYWGPTRRLNPLRYFYERGDGAMPSGERLDTDRLIAGLTTAGWHVPINGQGLVETRGGRVHFSVVNDAHVGLDRLDQASERPSVDDDVILQLGITHAPYQRVLDHYVDLGCDLLLAGHTHGGQVCVPFYGALVSNCDLPPAKARGLSDHRGVPLVVTAGLGHSTYAPFRFACRPEVRIIEVMPNSSPA